MFDYGLLAVFIYQALSERKNHGKNIPLPFVVAFVLTSFFGWIDEIIQAILPNRFYDIRDVIFNTLAAFMSIIMSMSLSWIQERVGKPSLKG